jgi:hypothetical protein
MSCYWDVRCLDCGEDLGIDNANHAVELMRSLVAHAKTLAALDPFVKEVGRTGHFIDFSFGCGSSLHTAWFVKHADHRLVGVNEYGRLDDECGTRISCPTCGKDDHCRRLAGHDGDHSHKRGSEL